MTEADPYVQVRGLQMLDDESFLGASVPRGEGREERRPRRRGPEESRRPPERPGHDGVGRALALKGRPEIPPKLLNFCNPATSSGAFWLFKIKNLYKR